MNKKIFFFLGLIYIFFIPEKVYSKCNFKTADYIEELSTPSNIKDIKVSISNSRKFVVNSAKILISEKKNIDSKFKKKYRADIQVNYPFGKCQYKARAWQNGDWKDHIKWTDSGDILNSLNIKLDEGNILNSVKFKLLIPYTRNGINEILGSLILRNLGFIAPETFEVKADINNVKSIMLFQEDSQKELLERNRRREGPIFEGDESIMWGNYKSKEDVMFLEKASLSRLINWKWFLKGYSSQSISLNSLTDLQYSYLPMHRPGGNVINPNFRKNSIFEDYYFLMSTMGGAHALRPHNRKFYFNALENSFEPIYYDGMIKLDKEIDLNNSWLDFNKAFSKTYNFKFAKIINSPLFLDQIKNQFKKRVIKFDKGKNLYIENSLINLSKNIRKLDNHLKNIESTTFVRKDMDYVFSDYENTLREKGVSQKIITSYHIKNKNIELIIDEKYKEIFTIDDFSQLISKNKYYGTRYVFLPKEKVSKKDNDLIQTYSNSLKGDIIHNSNIKFDLDEENKILNIKQLENNGWILFKNINLDSWIINFEGKEYIKKDTNSIIDQRFNKYGITGCLNFYQTNFNNARIKVNNGGCEDSLNIINSKGFIHSVLVNNAYQDAIDLDFSDLTLQNIEVNNAGNDCFDVSGGKYKINKGEFNICGDKGLSIGEKSELSAQDVFIENSYIGTSVKDFSLANYKNLEIINGKTCVEAMQKKQEFGGGKILIDNLICKNGINTIDKNSSVKISTNEL